MPKLFRRTSFVIALILGGFSIFLAFEQEYEAAMAGAGVAVATATARNHGREDSEDADESEETEWYKQQYKELRTEIKERDDAIRYERETTREIAELKSELSLLRQKLEQQDKMRQMELEIERLKISQQLLSGQQELKILQESELEVVEGETTETQAVEESPNNEDDLC
ncbi:MAG: hypothetical protein AAF716_11160 [Cyanobacteria bacterium P01_D01_bin.1]